MTFLKAVRRKAVGLAVLAIACIATEQIVYCVAMPVYFFQLLVSPVFWGGFSWVCFSGLWWMNQQYPNTEEPENKDYEEQSQQESYDYDPMWDHPLSLSNPLNLCKGFGSWL